MEYAKILASIIQMHPKERDAIRIAARYRYNQEYFIFDIIK